jgi:glutathionyl-hydroquinone reductase
MTYAPDAAYASDVDYEAYGRYSSRAKLDDASRAGADSLHAAFRSLSAFRGRLGAAPFAVEGGRYHLYLAAGCPFCHRLLIALRHLGLEEIVSHSFVDDERDGRGWAFRARRGADPVNGFRLLSEAYLATDPNFNGHIGAPVLWDRRTERIVSNHSGDILIDFATQFAHLARATQDLYPEELRAEIDALNEELEAELNFGVYLAGLAKSESEHVERVRRIFDFLEALEARLGATRFLFGERPTIADIRLFVTLARFDAAYLPVFRVDLKPLVDFPNLWAYARDLFRLPAFRDVTDVDRYRSDYERNFPTASPGAAPPAADWMQDPRRELMTSADSRGQP